MNSRLIPLLQVLDRRLVKTVKFRNPAYIGDPLNTVRIFNELEVDEMALVDIRASLEKREPDGDWLKRLARECFMPLSYGGGIHRLDQAEKLFSLGFEKLIIGSAAYTHPGLLEELAARFGTQSLVVSVDVKKNFLGKEGVYIESGTRRIPVSLMDWIRELQERGAGEILITSINREGTWQGLDQSLIHRVSQAVRLPVMAHGGASSLDDLSEAVGSGASSIAVGNMVVYQKKGAGVLIHFPDARKLKERNLYSGMD